jgi:hypothetical protein
MEIVKSRGVHFNPKRRLMPGLLVRLRLICVMLLGAACVAVVGPPNPPPHGQVWVESGGQWVLVPTPPSEGPYVWAGGRWVPDPTPPPPGAEWVPGHWGPSGWVRGHWTTVPTAGPGAVWVSGHWKGGAWVPGHWGPRGRWVSGHWR